MKVESICCNLMSKASRLLSSMETGRRLQNQCTYFTFIAALMSVLFPEDLLKTERTFWQ